MRLCPLLLMLPLVVALSGGSVAAQAQSQPSASQRKTALDKVFSEYWEDQLKH